MEAVNSFVMSWWPVFAGIFGVLVLLAQLWSGRQQAESEGLRKQIAVEHEANHEHFTELYRQLNQTQTELHSFQMRALTEFITSKDLERLTGSVDSLKQDMTRWLERIENTLQNKADR